MRQNEILNFDNAINNYNRLLVTRLTIKASVSQRSGIPILFGILVQEKPLPKSKVAKRSMQIWGKPSVCRDLVWDKI